MVDPRVSRAAAGDREAAESLVRSLLPRARNFARTLLGGDEHVDAVARDALLGALRGLASAPMDQPFERWVDRHVVRESLRRLPSLRGDDSVTVKRPGARVLRLDRREGNSTAQLILALDALYDDQRVLVAMHRFAGMPFEVIASELRISKDRAVARYRTGVARLDYLLSMDDARRGA